jgi:hypothetical protein
LNKTTNKDDIQNLTKIMNEKIQANKEITKAKIDEITNYFEKQNMENQKTQIITNNKIEKLTNTVEKNTAFLEA